MTILQRAKRLWTQLSTEEVYDQSGSRGRRSIVRRGPRN
jgi:hypothetical protein